MLRIVAVATLLVGATAAWADTIEEKAALCSACHGDNGLPDDPATPIIWGQNEGYLYLELRDFQKGARKDDRMTPIAQSLAKEDALALAAYFPPSHGRRPASQRLQKRTQRPRWSPKSRSFARAAIWRSFKAIQPSRGSRASERLSRQDHDRFPQSRHARPTIAGMSRSHLNTVRTPERDRGARGLMIFLSRNRACGSRDGIARKNVFAPMPRNPLKSRDGI